MVIAVIGEGFDLLFQISVGSAQSHMRCIGKIQSFHRCAKLPTDDVAALVLKDRGQVEPAPADDFEIGLLENAID